LNPNEKPGINNLRYDVTFRDYFTKPIDTSKRRIIFQRQASLGKNKITNMVLVGKHEIKTLL
jgi:hypothetical protein